VSLVEGDGIAGHETTHDFAERGKALFVGGGENVLNEERIIALMIVDWRLLIARKHKRIISHPVRSSGTAPVFLRGPTPEEWTAYSTGHRVAESSTPNSGIFQRRINLRFASTGGVKLMIGD
jgi:hypothetical protein